MALLISLRFVDLPDRLFSTVSHAWFPLSSMIQVALLADQGGVVAATRCWPPGSHKNPGYPVITGLILRAIVWSVMLLSIPLTRRQHHRAGSKPGVGVLLSPSPYKNHSERRLSLSLSIGFDKPFEIGDFVVFNDVAERWNT